MGHILEQFSPFFTDLAGILPRWGRDRDVTGSFFAPLQLSVLEIVDNLLREDRRNGMARLFLSVGIHLYVIFNDCPS
ncbi:hypothetical protein CKA32_001160 [Geitlerinema sp. FC II]|nr:hypothetical protein CKA32_001160 [Geitlerinema sp. FC II]